MSVGLAIHVLGEDQDLRKSGGVMPIAPVTAGASLIGTLALVGWPFMTAYYSKEPLVLTASSIEAATSTMVSG